MLLRIPWLLRRRNYPMLTDARPVNKMQRSDVNDLRPDAKEILFQANVRNPKRLAIHLDSLQSSLRQLCFFQTQKSKVRQIAQHRLKPAVIGEEFAHSPVQKFIRVESQHSDVLRSSGRGDRIKHRFREIFAEKYSV